MGSSAFGPGSDGTLASADLATARQIFDAALDAGVNLMDTADSYGAGVSEEVVGEVMRGRPDAMLVSTKVAFPTGSTPNDRGLSRHHIIESVHGSLHRLQRNHIDLYHLHMWDGLTPVEETLAALDHLVQTGKVRYIAVSNFAAWQLMKFIAAADKMGAPRPIAQQIHYTPHVRDAEFDLLPLGADQGVGTLVWSPLAGGLLTGKYRRNEPAPAGSRHAGGVLEPPVGDESRLFDIVETLTDVADAHGASPSQVALAYTLRRSGVTSLVIGPRRPDQLTDNLGALDVTLTEDDLSRIEQVSRPPVPYPLWHQIRWDLPRLGPAELPYLGQYST